MNIIFNKQEVKRYPYLGKDTNAPIWSLMRKWWDLGRGRHRPIQSANVNLFLVAEQDHTSPVIGQERYFGVESTTKQCSRNAPLLSVNHNLSLHWVHIPEPGVVISSRDASMLPPNDVCQETSSSYKTMYHLVMSTNNHLPGNVQGLATPAHVNQPMNIKQHIEATKTSSFLLCQHIPTKQRLRSNIYQAMLGYTCSR